MSAFFGAGASDRTGSTVRARHRHVGKTTILLLLAALSACGGGSSSGDRTPPPVEPPPADPELGLDARPVNLTCEAPSRAAVGTAQIALEAVFADVAFDQPLAMLQVPGDAERWFVLEKPGRVLGIDSAGGPTVAAEVLDLNAHFPVDDRSEGGLLGMAFHPDFAANGQVFLSWTEGPPMVSVVARFQSPDRTSIEPASRVDVIRLNQPFENHNGGHIAFGPDGHFYIGFGDGGSGGDPDGHAQDTTDLLGAFLRLDVDGGTPYAIPADNPFAGNPPCTPDPNVSAASCPEIFAWGLRNPWRWSFDAGTGELWAGDVGQGSREEVDRIELGGNYGWDCREGSIPFSGTPAASCSTATGLIDPVHDYPRSEGSSITGGHVYRGAALPALVGSYVFGDYGNGRISRLAADGVGGFTAQELLDTDLSIVSFAEGLDRELYVVDIAGGLYRIVAGSAESPDPPDPPVAAVLSATGCVDAADPQRAAAGLIPYEVAAPFWSDGASKERWLAIPDGQTVAVEADGDFSFPNGSVLMKHFRLADRLIETRLFMRHPEGDWAGYSYRWNDEQTDAVLVNGGAVAEVEGQRWIFPARDDCMMCHTSAAGFALGPEAAQLDHAITYPSTGRTANQLATLSGIGLTASPLPAAPAPVLVDPYDTTLPLDERARALLHTNCAQCHRLGGPAPGPLDLRFDLTLAATNACDAIPAAGDLDLGPAARIIAPGEPNLSALFSRMSRRDAYGMPPLASNLVDTAGIELIRSWITSLEGC